MNHMNINNNDAREQQLTEDVMRRVRFIHTLRILLSPAMVKSVVLLASIVATILLVSIPHCIANMSHLSGLMAYSSYIAGAYVHTNFVVQAVIVLAFAAGAWLAGDIARNLSYSRFLRFGRA